jgi:hypothetical protein
MNAADAYIWFIGSSISAQPHADALGGIAPRIIEDVLKEHGARA